MDVNRSQWDCTPGRAGRLGAAPRLGFRMLHGLAQAHALRILRAVRRPTGFHDLRRHRPADQTEPGGVGVRGQGLCAWFARLEPSRLVSCACFGPGSKGVATVRPRRRRCHHLFCFCSPFRDSLPRVRAALPAMSTAEEVLADYRTAGLSLRGHPLELLCVVQAAHGRRAGRQAETLDQRQAGRRGRHCPDAAAAIDCQGHHLRHPEDETDTANLINTPVGSLEAIPRGTRGGLISF